VDVITICEYQQIREILLELQQGGVYGKAVEERA
jgi:hypothetical protein